MKKKRGAVIFHISVGLVVFIILSILSIHLYLKKHSSEIFTYYLEKILSRQDSIYTIKQNSVDIDLLGGQIILKNLRISFDEEKLINTDLRTEWLLKASIPVLSIRGISISDLIISHKVTAERILLKKGDLKFYISMGRGDKKKVKGKTGRLPPISIGGIVIEDSNIEFFTGISSSPKSSLKGINLDTGKIEYRPVKPSGKNSRHKIPDFQFRGGNSFLFFKKSGYKIVTGPIKIGSAGSSASVKDFVYEPASEEILNQKLIQRGRFHRFRIPELSLRNIDLKELIDKGRFKAGQIYINKPDLYFYRNKNKKNSIGKKTKIFPQQIFRESGLKADIDLIRIKKGIIKYTEIAIGEKRGESLMFKDLNTSFHDVSNFPEILKKGKESEILVSTRVMGKSLLNGKILIPVNHRENRFYFSGLLSKTDPSLFNRFLKRNIRIRIDKGKLNHMTFKVNADKNRASGSMRLSYNNLHVTLLRKKNSGRKSRFATFMANTLTHKNNPTRTGKKLRTGEIAFERKVKGSIFNFMWKCILTGIKSSVKL